MHSVVDLEKGTGKNVDLILFIALKEKGNRTQITLLVKLIKIALSLTWLMKIMFSQIV